MELEFNLEGTTLCLPVRLAGILPGWHDGFLAKTCFFWKNGFLFWFAAAQAMDPQ